MANEIAAERKRRRSKLKNNRYQDSDSGKHAPVTIVSGLPRSGTSMLMQMLQAGGMKLFTDSQRRADADNPKGYFEHRSSMLIESDASWIPLARGSAVKIICQHLPVLPEGESYKVIFMDRNMKEVIESQKAMLDRKGRKGGNLRGCAVGRARRCGTERPARRCDLAAVRDFAPHRGRPLRRRRSLTSSAQAAIGAPG